LSSWCFCFLIFESSRLRTGLLQGPAQLSRQLHPQLRPQVPANADTLPLA
jgi:hypothetical protein